MAVTAVKTFVAGEILTASDLNALNTNILNNGEDLGWPATQSKDLDGQSLIFDSDADTYATAATDDTITWTIGGVDLIVMSSSGITIGGSKVVTGGFLNRIGVPTLIHRVSTLEARASDAENYALFVNHASSF